MSNSLPEISVAPRHSASDGSAAPARESKAKHAIRKAKTLDEKEFKARSAGAGLTPTQPSGGGVGSFRRASISNTTTSGSTRQSRNSTESPMQPRIHRSRSMAGEVTGSKTTGCTCCVELSRKLKEAQDRLVEETAMLEDWRRRGAELQRANAALKEELADAKQASADSEEVFQLSMELKKVKQSLASSNYESTMARKMQDEMGKKLAEARAECRKIQAQGDAVREQLLKMQSFWGPLEAKTAENMRGDAMAHIEKCLKDYQTLPYRECATMVDVLRNKYLPNNNQHLPALHAWFFEPILKLIQEKGRAALLRSQAVIPEGLQDELAAEARSRVREQMRRTNRLMYGMGGRPAQRPARAH
eukprot:jgi/Tetstr1/436633/TSEL_025429.t1